ncbi:glycosyltransferase family 2 protein [Salipiger marinus]|uniref:Glycosyltransferase involved in cell wall bisynthesis n=1 Tax=Salipiger marinus TaxID=555512 RepID=A0A1G8QKV2_9RHOB|nr:glycosyltransferase family 2 protein [Salipiger marinus]SDJ05429.1 Glycosyltransferase involved in cell wall bisynthesis [Salipiger marinus]
MSLTVIILTKDEERHIARAINAIHEIADQILVVDSGSTDNTVEIARGLGAIVLENPWTNYATQLNWAIDNVPESTEWIMRLDADEIVQPALAREIAEGLPRILPKIDGIYVSRRMTFLRRPILWGGVFPVRVLRLFRKGRGRCEMRWMDEHILVEGPTVDFQGELIDDNHNSLTWWTQKHNSYASREVVDMLNLEYGFMPHETIADLRGVEQAGVKRWLKENVYARLPGGLRAFVYFLYRYLLRLGFLDGAQGTAFHVLQGFWYRYLVDMKLYEVKAAMARDGLDAVSAIREVLGITVNAQDEGAKGRAGS